MGEIESAGDAGDGVDLLRELRLATDNWLRCQRYLGDAVRERDSLRARAEAAEQSSEFWRRAHGEWQAWATQQCAQPEHGSWGDTEMMRQLTAQLLASAGDGVESAEAFVGQLEHEVFDSGCVTAEVITLIAGRDARVRRAAIRECVELVKVAEVHYGSEAEGRGDPDFGEALACELALRIVGARLCALLEKGGG